MITTSVTLLTCPTISINIDAIQTAWMSLDVTGATLTISPQNSGIAQAETFDLVFEIIDGTTSAVTYSETLPTITVVDCRTPTGADLKFANPRFSSS